MNDGTNVHFAEVFKNWVFGREISKNVIFGAYRLLCAPIFWQGRFHILVNNYGSSENI
jgi:hypothetical protein